MSIQVQPNLLPYSDNYQPLPAYWEMKMDPFTQWPFFVDHPNRRTTWLDPRYPYGTSRYAPTSLPWGFDGPTSDCNCGYCSSDTEYPYFGFPTFYSKHRQPNRTRNTNNFSSRPKVNPSKNHTVSDLPSQTSNTDIQAKEDLKTKNKINTESNVSSETSNTDIQAKEDLKTKNKINTESNVSSETSNTDIQAKEDLKTKNKINTESNVSSETSNTDVHVDSELKTETQNLESHPMETESHLSSETSNNDVHVDSNLKTEPQTLESRPESHLSSKTSKNDVHVDSNLKTEPQTLESHPMETESNLTLEVSNTDEKPNDELKTEPMSGTETQSEFETEVEVLKSEEIQSRLSNILQIRTKVEDMSTKIDDFTGSKNSKEYLILDETLLFYLIQLDQIQAERVDDIRKSRKAVVLLIQDLLRTLENKAYSDNDR